MQTVNVMCRQQYRQLSANYCQQLFTKSVKRGFRPPFLDYKLHEILYVVTIFSEGSASSAIPLLNIRYLRRLLILQHLFIGNRCGA